MTSVRTDPGEINTIQSPEISSTSSKYTRTNRRLYPICRRQIRYSRIPNYFVPEEIPLHPDPTNHRPVAQVKHKVSTRNAVISVLLIFMCSIGALSYVYMSFPELEEQEKPHIKLPWDIEEAKQLGIVLDKYKERYYFQVLSGVFVTYIFLQTFAIPGSLFLSILSGFLFPFPLALVLVCVCSMTGASLCYLLSQLLGRRIVQQFFPERARKWAVTVDKHRDNIFNYILFLRMTPFLPNWFINLTAPVIGVPLVPFALGTFIGVGPPSFIAIQAGQTLYKMTSSSDAWSWTSVLLLAVFAILSLLPVFLKRQLRQKFE